MVNDPVSVRNAPEKLFVTQFPELMPPTLITYDTTEIKAFRAEHKDIIVKPHLRQRRRRRVPHPPRRREPQQPARPAGADRARAADGAALPAGDPQGDKRIVLIDGEPAGAVNRVPPPGDARANLHVGGRAEKATLTRRDLEICEALGPVLRAAGPDVRRHRRDRRLADRDQRDLADRPAGDRPLRRRLASRARSGTRSRRATHARTASCRPEARSRAEKRYEPRGGPPGDRRPATRHRARDHRGVRRPAAGSGARRDDAEPASLPASRVPASCRRARCSRA